MTEKDADAVSLDKPSGEVATIGRPKQISWIVAVLALCGLGAVGASASLYGLHHFLVHQLTVSNHKLKPTERKTRADVLHTASIQPGVSMIESALFLVVLLFVARAVWRGRYWSRWAVIGLWILATFTGIYGGVLQISALFADAPLVLKVPIFVSSVSFVAAVAMVVFIKPVVAWLNLTRPERSAAGPAPARRSMFAPRPPAAPIENESRSGASTERARAKQRVTPETVPRAAADSSRARARSSKSRRSDS